MMTCQTYIFKLTSSQLDEAGWVERLGAAQHRLVCRHCRAFTKNDEQLQVLLRRYREDVKDVDQVLDP